MNRNALMEYLNRNGWEALRIGRIAEYEHSVSVTGTHGDACVSLDIKKRELDGCDPCSRKEESCGHD